MNDKEIDWRVVRTNAAIKFTERIISSDTLLKELNKYRSKMTTAEVVVSFSVELADELIKELKKGG